MPKLNIYDPFRNMQFNDRHCFLCGTEITLQQRVPVFPEWLMERYNLADKELLLLDKSIVSHKDLTIPCCDSCHINHISPMEQEVKQAAEQGLEGWKQLPENRVFQWLGKIFYGMLVTELIKEQDPLVRPEYAVSEEPKMLSKFYAFFQVLQSIRVPIVFDDFQPFSLFIVSVKDDERIPAFEYNDDLTTMTCSIKLDNVALVCVFVDNGIMKKQLRRVWQDVDGKQLSAKQLAEIKARVFYAAYLFGIVPEYIPRTVKPEDHEVVYDTFVDDVMATVFAPFQLTGYAQMFQEMLKPWDIRQEQILENPEMPISFLYDEEGNLLV